MERVKRAQLGNVRFEGSPHSVIPVMRDRNYGIGFLRDRVTGVRPDGRTGCLPYGNRLRGWVFIKITRSSHFDLTKEFCNYPPEYLQRLAIAEQICYAIQHGLVKKYPVTRLQLFFREK